MVCHLPLGQRAAERLPVDLDEDVALAQVVRDGRVCDDHAVEGVALARLLLHVRQPVGLHRQAQTVLVIVVCDYEIDVSKWDGVDIIIACMGYRVMYCMGYLLVNGVCHRVHIPRLGPGGSPVPPGR